MSKELCGQTGEWCIHLARLNEELKRLRAKLRKASRAGKVLAQGWYCPPLKNAGVQHNERGPHAVLPRACFCEHDEPCFKGCRRVEVREVKGGGK